MLRLKSQRLALGLFAALIASGAAPAFAQPDKSVPPASEERDVMIKTEPQGNPIVVTGERSIEKDTARDAVRDIAMRGRTAFSPLMRYQDPLCLSINGFGDDLGARMKARIEEHTRDAGLEIGEPGCTHNAIIILTDNPEALVKNIKKQRPRFFTPSTTRRIKAALGRGYPALTWFLTQRRGKRGTDLSRDAPQVGSLLGANAGATFQATDAWMASRFEIPFSVARLLTFVVFDAYDLDGVHIDQLSDYATMRILGNPQPRAKLGADQPDSILNLFWQGPDNAPPGLTQVDKAYLKGLYAMRPNDPGNRLEKFVLAALEEEVEVVE